MPVFQQKLAVRLSMHLVRHCLFIFQQNPAVASLHLIGKCFFSKNPAVLHVYI